MARNTCNISLKILDSVGFARPSHGLHTRYDRRRCVRANIFLIFSSGIPRAKKTAPNDAFNERSSSLCHQSLQDCRFVFRRAKEILA